MVEYEKNNLKQIIVNNKHNITATRTDLGNRINESWVLFWSFGKSENRSIKSDELVIERYVAYYQIRKIYSTETKLLINI
jgi:hypothetical protein